MQCILYTKLTSVMEQAPLCYKKSLSKAILRSV